MINPMNEFGFMGGVFTPDMSVTMQEKPLAMAFVRNQTELDIMDTEEGFCTGTIFNGLNKPWCPGGAAR